MLKIFNLPLATLWNEQIIQMICSGQKKREIMFTGMIYKGLCVKIQNYTQEVMWLWNWAR